MASEDELNFLNFPETLTPPEDVDPSPKSLSKSFSNSKLNAKAAEFIPRIPKQHEPSFGIPRLQAPMKQQEGSFGIPKLQAPVHVYAGTRPGALPLTQPPGGYQHYSMPFYGGADLLGSVALSPRGLAPVAVAALGAPSAGELEKGKSAGGGGGSKAVVSDEVSRKILNQVEYYFSDLNLATTDHLIRHMLKDPEGYVSMSVVASFKKIKVSIGSNFQLANILRCSEKLVVSDDGKKVKRVNHLTESDVEELQSRIVVAENLPEDHCHQSLMKMFSAVGSVKSIRTCQPQNPNGGPSPASRTAKTEGSHYSNKLHAFAEYESAELAEKAVTELNDKNNWRNGLKVRLLIIRSKANSSQARMKAGHENDPDALLPEESDANDVGENDGEHKKARNRGKGKGRGRPQYQGSKSRGGIIGSPPSVNVLASNEQVTGNKQGSVPRMPDGTRGFSMGRGKRIAIRSA